MTALRRVRGGTFGLIVLFVASACGSSATPAASAPPAPPGSIAVSTTAGDVIATADLLPEEDGVVQGTGPDGAVYTLKVPALALAKPTTISFRPLKTVTIPGGRLVSGVELEPEGTMFSVPVTLMISPASGTHGLVPFRYSGSAATAVAQVGLVKALDPASVTLWLGHFSGAFMAAPGNQDGANRWTYPNEYPKDGTPGQRLEWATSAIAALEWHKVSGDDTGAIPVSQQMDGLAAQAAAAAADVAKNLPGLVKKANDGRLEDAYDFLDEVNAVSVIAAASGRADESSDGSAYWDAIQSLSEIRDTYYTNLIKNLEADQTFTKRLSRGSETDFDELESVFAILLGASRQGQLLAQDEFSNTLTGKVTAWMHQYGMAMGASCGGGHWINSRVVGGLGHLLAIAGDDAATLAIQDCLISRLPSPCPGADLVPGADGAQLAETNVCGPSGTPIPIPTPKAAEDQPVTDHVSVKGHGVTEGLSSNLGQAQDGKSIADITIEMDVQVASVGGIVQAKLLSGSYAITGSSTGDCVGSGSENGSMSVSHEHTVTNAAGNISINIDWQGDYASMNTSFEYPVICSRLTTDLKGNEYVVKEPSSGSGGVDGYGCQLKPGAPETTCQNPGTTWTLSFARG